MEDTDRRDVLGKATIHGGGGGSIRDRLSVLGLRYVRDRDRAMIAVTPMVGMDGR